MSASRILVARAWPWLLSLVILLPVLRPGFVLTYDMVFVPDLAFRSDFLGLGSGLPRAVPSDAVISLLDELVPGDLLQKVLLVGALGLAGLGARRLVPADNLSAQLAATTFYIWNPFVAERLGIGHWPLLLAYAALPWLYDAARRARAGERTMPSIWLWLALAALSAAGGVIAAVFALVCVVGRGRDAWRRTVLVMVGAVAVNAPWILAGTLHGSGALSDPRGVEAFAARAEGILPLTLTLLGLGGIWNSEVVPASRTGVAALIALVLLVVVCACGAWRWRPVVEQRDRAALIVAGVIGLVVALAGAVAPEALAWLASNVPGGGLLRDGTRFLALLAPLEACLFGLGVSALGGLVPTFAARVLVVTCVVLAPMALMPDLGLGLAGRLQSVQYPAEYAAARTAIDERLQERGGGDLLLLPFNSYRLPSWNGGRRTLDPVGRYLTPNYLASDTLYVSGERIAGEDARARRVEELLDEDLSTEELARALGAEGIAWVLLDKEAADLVGDAAPSADLHGLPVVHEGDRLVVWELPTTVTTARSTAEEAAVWTAWLVAGAAVLASLVLVLTRRGRTLRQLLRSR